MRAAAISARESIASSRSCWEEPWDEHYKAPSYRADGLIPVI